MPKSKNLARNLPVNTAKLSKAVQQNPPTDRDAVHRLVKKLKDGITGGDLSESDHQQQLHSVRSWGALKKVTLEHRHLPVPHSALPANEKELYEFCQFLLSRDSDDEMRRNYLKVVAGDQNPDKFLKNFCHKLWETSSLTPQFYRDVVSANHREAIRFLQKNRRSNALPQADGARLLYVMALIWAAHDAQTSTALAWIASTRPLGWLLMGVGKRITAGTIFAIFRPVFHVISGLFGQYPTGNERRAGKPNGKLPRKDLARNVEKQIAPGLSRSQLREHSRASRDRLIVDLRDDMATKSDDFWDEVRLTKSSGKYDRTRMSQVWYADLTPVEVATVPVLRFIQTEQMLLRQIEAWLRHPTLPRASLLPIFDPAKLQRGWKTRARLLIADQRRVILKDADKDSGRIAAGETIDDAAAGEPSKYDPLIDSVSSFLQRAALLTLRGNTRFHPEVRTLAKLDIATNRRFGFK